MIVMPPCTMEKAGFDTRFFARGENHIVDSIFWVFDSVHIFCW